MRFSSLDLIAFGHFSNAKLTFAAAPGVVEVVYGDNEAGKSTSLRAIGSLLYGIPARTIDDFLHPMPTLRIGATIVGADGRAIPCVRRKGLKDTLRDANDLPLDSGFLERALGGLDRDMFEQMYALSRAQLERGATDLLTGNGSLGEALFGASLGLAGVNDILKALEVEAATIFKAHGHNPKLNGLLSELAAVRRRAREAELRPAEYQELEEGLERALAERQRLEQELSRIEVEIQSARRNQQLLPLEARRSQLAAEYESYRDTPRLSDTARDERVAAERELRAATGEIERCESKSSELREKLETLVPRAQLLAHAQQIRDLHQDIGAHQKAARDLPGIKATHRRAVEQAEALLREAHPDRTLADADDLRPSAVVRAAITELSDEHVRLTEAKRASEKTVTGERRNVTRAQSALASLSAPEPVTALRGALEAARKLGEIEAELRGEATRLASLEEELAAELGSLGFAGSSTELEALPVPGDATVARFVKEEDRLRAGRSTVTTLKAGIEVRLREERQALSALDLAGAVATELDLNDARSRREDRWQVVRSALVSADRNLAPEATTPLADDYEESVRDSDEIADRLRREADRVAKKASYEAAISSLERESEELDEELRELDGEAVALASEWGDLWQPAGIPPLTAAEMHEWLTTRARVVGAARQLRSDRARHEGRVAAVAGHRNAVSSVLHDAGHPLPAGISLAAALEIADEVVQDHTARTAALTSARERVEDAEQREREAIEAEIQASSALDTWQARWAVEVRKLGLDPALKPDQVRAVIESVDEMVIALGAAAKDEARINGIERDARLFQEAVAAIVAAAAPELRDLAEDHATAQLHRMLDVAQSDATQSESIETQLAELDVSLEEATVRRRSAENELERLMQDANCSTMEALAVAEERSAMAGALRNDLAAVDEQITMIAAASPDEVAAQVEGLDVDLLAALLEQLEQQKAELAQHHREAAEEVGEKRTRLAAIRGGDDAAELHAEAESIRAEIRTQAEQYAKLRLAGSILRRQIDEFRERSHGPLLARAGHYFSRLTCGSCVGLTTGFDDRKGDLILLGRRKNGSEITVGQMSTGTRDQLYLALRLATLEQQTERGDPLPLIVDDLFEGYDDSRASAGFEALAEIAGNTQVIFFTHHRHLVEIAQQTLSSECSVQELGVAGIASAEAA